MNGFILESKSIMDSEIWNKPPLYFKIWHYLLLNAQYQDYKGLKRGQIRTSIPEIQEAMKYKKGYVTVKPTYQEVRDVINYLKKGSSTKNNTENNTNNSMITTTNTTRGFIATICNYNKYQNIKSYEQQGEKQTEKQHEQHSVYTNHKELINNKDITKKNYSYRQRQRLMTDDEINFNLRNDPDWQEVLKERGKH